MATEKKGIDEFKDSPTVFVDFTRGTTLPFAFRFLESVDPDVPIDVTDWQVWISISYEMNSDVPDVEVRIPIFNAAEGAFAGEISDDITYSLSESSIVYMSARYIRPDGATFVFDKAKVRVYDAVTSRRELG